MKVPCVLKTLTVTVEVLIVSMCCLKYRHSVVLTQTMIITLSLENVLIINRTLPRVQLSPVHMFIDVHVDKGNDCDI